MVFTRIQGCLEPQQPLHRRQSAAGRGRMTHQVGPQDEAQRLADGWTRHRNGLGAGIGVAG
jgi:hypothetical protein